ncbi:MAG TPA: hypothetical protein VFA68_00365 [Terriglobales bacterium]|nr:hypothetical protein [Terriglobales bacterium]
MSQLRTIDLPISISTMLMKRNHIALKAGDVVEVRPAGEIIKTLNTSGALDNLPFMPEMLQFCGKRFRVLHRVVQATIDAAFLNHTESFVREFRNNDVVILQGVRCSGVEHDACQRGCAVFWKEAWLKKVDTDQLLSAIGARTAPAAMDLLPILRTRAEDGMYFCQSSEFPKATLHLSGRQRVKKCFSAVAAGNISTWGMVKRNVRWMWWRGYSKLFGQFVHGSQEKTPTESLGLQPGELVEVKSLPEIIATLNIHGRNRGLHFSADQRPFCGKRYRVRSRADNFIVEGTGEMKHFRDTVILEDVLCDSTYFAFGGCYRADLLYWREIWLKRVEAASDVTASPAAQACAPHVDAGVCC